MDELRESSLLFSLKYLHLPRHERVGLGLGMLEIDRAAHHAAASDTQRAAPAARRVEPHQLDLDLERSRLQAERLRLAQQTQHQQRLLEIQSDAAQAKTRAWIALAASITLVCLVAVALAAVLRAREVTGLTQSYARLVEEQREALRVHARHGAQQAQELERAQKEEQRLKRLASTPGQTQQTSAPARAGL